MTGYWKPDPAPVLIAENDDIVADLIATIVEFAGYTPVVATNGRLALEQGRKHRPALLIAESILPELDGAGLINTLRAQKGSYLPTIVVTSSPRTTWDSIRPDAILMKPFHVATLEVLLARFLHFGPPPCVDPPKHGFAAPAGLPELALKGG